MKYVILFLKNSELLELPDRLEDDGNLTGYEIVNVSWAGPSACVVLKKVSEE